MTKVCCWDKLFTFGLMINLSGLAGTRWWIVRICVVSLSSRRCDVSPLLCSAACVWPSVQKRPHTCLQSSAWKSSIRRFVSTEKAHTRAFSWLKAATTAFTFKTLLRHYAKRALTPRSLSPIRHYANQTARPLWPLCRGPNFTLRDRGVNAHLA